MKFSGLEAASRHRVLSTRCGHSAERKLNGRSRAEETVFRQLLFAEDMATEFEALPLLRRWSLSVAGRIAASLAASKVATKSGAIQFAAHPIQLTAKPRRGVF